MPQIWFGFHKQVETLCGVDDWDTFVHKPEFGAEGSTFRLGVNPLLHIRDTTLSIKSNSWKLLFFPFHYRWREGERWGDELRDE